jgi:hypothetical protein
MRCERKREEEERMGRIFSLASYGLPLPCQRARAEQPSEKAQPSTILHRVPLVKLYEWTAAVLTA